MFFLVLYHFKTHLNIKHIAKTDSDKYLKGKCNQYILADIFRQGIFAVDGGQVVTAEKAY